MHMWRKVICCQLCPLGWPRSLLKRSDLDQFRRGEIRKTFLGGIHHIITSNILWDLNIIYQPKFEKVTYGKNTFKYYGSHIWNLLPNEIKETAEILSFKSLIIT